MIIGLTGNIATGKSTVMAVAAERGAYTIDADRVVHQLYAADGNLLAQIRAQFGDDVFDGETLNRKRLGGIVFGDGEALKRLEGIVVPAVRHEIGRRLRESSADITILEAIKLLESPLHEHCDQIWVTTCSTETQIERLMQHRGLTHEQAVQRVNAQPPQSEKISKADVIIDTNGTMEETIARIKKIMKYEV